MENFLLSILAQVVATEICCAIRYIYIKVKNHSNGLDCTPNVGQYI